MRIRIAMWSGPRNISTALLRSWGNRPDTAVVDEPLYGHYLTQVEVNHPGRAEVVAAMETDWRKVVTDLTGDIPDGKPIWYQKHMAHHLLPHLTLDWLDRLANCFLIRHPAEMLASLNARMGLPALRDTGLTQQAEIFRRVRDRTGRIPPVLDAADVLTDPPALLRRLCKALAVPFDEHMLAWPPGPRSTDGVWARYWYDAVERSSGFEPYRPRPREVPPPLEPLLQECMPYYEALSQFKL